MSPPPEVPENTASPESPSGEHREAAKKEIARCAVLTISDTRTKETDEGGSMIKKALQHAGHQVWSYEIVKDEADQIESQLKRWLAEKEYDLIITTGGTGISSRDTTIEVVNRLLDKQLLGFGELFRMLSFDEIGSSAMLSRATGGLSGETLIFSLPGSKNAIYVAMSQLIMPEIKHLIWERKR